MALSIEGVSDCDEISLVYVKNELHITLTIKINPLPIKSDTRSFDLIPSSPSPPPSTPDDSLSVEKAHDISTQVQNLLLENTNASRVIVHAEPV
jgi:divalent metal cation (Fe/Co/Zn/Cd) transporter